MEKGIDRRSFLAGTGVVAAAGAFAALTGCSSKPSTSDSGSKGEKEVTYDIADTKQCDVAVIGLGAAGLLAAIGAADNGAKSVIAIDAAPSWAGSTNTSTTGALIVESDAELAAEQHVTQKDVYEYLCAKDNMVINPGLMRNMLKYSGKAGNVLDEMNTLAPGTLVHTWELGLPWETLELSYKGGYMYQAFYGDRDKSFAALAASRSNLDVYWSCKAEKLLTDDSGAVCGPICDNDGTTTQIDASKVIVCCGGFISNPDMIEEYMHTRSLVSCSFPTVDGSGIALAKEVGANLGKNFGLSFDEMGGCSSNSSAVYAWAPDGSHNVSNLFYAPMFGCLTVNKQGRRFISESQMSGSLQMCSEPVLRQGSYYIVMDQKMMDTITSTEIFDIMSDEAKGGLVMSLALSFQGYVCKDFVSDFDTAVKEGWACKANSLKEIADTFGLEELENTVKTYNGFAKAGADDDFYVPADAMKPVEEGPFYCIELQPGAWCTVGGIQVDDFCRALDADAEPIANLFVAGLDADMFGVPYVLGATANGFSMASGYMAGETAAKEL